MRQVEANEEDRDREIVRHWIHGQGRGRRCTVHCAYIILHIKVYAGVRGCTRVYAGVRQGVCGFIGYLLTTDYSTIYQCSYDGGLYLWIKFSVYMHVK